MSITHAWSTPWGHHHVFPNIFENVWSKNQDKFAIAFKAIPTLMPYILEANTPSLNTFLKEGSQFSIKDLSSIHSALINFHNFVSDTQDSMDKNKAPSFHNLADLIKTRNLGRIFFSKSKILYMPEPISGKRQPLLYQYP